MKKILFIFVAIMLVIAAFQSNVQGQSSLIQNRIYDNLVIREYTGEADIDIDQADYTDFVNILQIQAPATGLLDCSVALDFNKTTTGWNDVATHGDVLDVIAVLLVSEGTNAGTQIALPFITSAASLSIQESGGLFRLGPIQANGIFQIQVKMNEERGDSEQPYRVTSVGAAPTITPVEIP